MVLYVFRSWLYGQIAEVFRWFAIASHKFFFLVNSASLQFIFLNFSSLKMLELKINIYTKMMEITLNKYPSRSRFLLVESRIVGEIIGSFSFKSTRSTRTECLSMCVGSTSKHVQSNRMKWLTNFALIASFSEI